MSTFDFKFNPPVGTTLSINFINASGSIFIDWGDGEITNFPFPLTNASHIYSGEGTYTVKMSGFKCDQINLSPTSYIVEILTQLPDFELKSANNLFKGSYSLTTIPEGLFDNNLDITSFDGTFTAALQLTAIPFDLFANHIHAESFKQTFAECNNLTSIPENLFANCNSVVDYSSAFLYCNNLAVSPLIFGLSSLQPFNNRNVNFSQMFKRSFKPTTSLPNKGSSIRLWEYDFGLSGSKITNEMFSNHSLYTLTDYCDIPVDFGGEPYTCNFYGHYISTTAKIVKYCLPPSTIFPLTPGTPGHLGYTIEYTHTYSAKKFDYPLETLPITLTRIISTSESCTTREYSITDTTYFYMGSSEAIPDNSEQVITDYFNTRSATRGQVRAKIDEIAAKRPRAPCCLEPDRLFLAIIHSTCSGKGEVKMILRLSGLFSDCFTSELAGATAGDTITQGYTLYAVAGEGDCALLPVPWPGNYCEAGIWVDCEQELADELEECREDCSCGIYIDSAVCWGEIELYPLTGLIISSPPCGKVAYSQYFEYCEILEECAE